MTLRHCSVSSYLCATIHQCMFHCCSQQCEDYPPLPCMHAHVHGSRNGTFIFSSAAAGQAAHGARRHCHLHKARDCEVESLQRGVPQNKGEGGNQGIRMVSQRLPQILFCFDMRREIQPSQHLPLLPSYFLFFLPTKPRSAALPFQYSLFLSLSLSPSLSIHLSDSGWVLTSYFRVDTRRSGWRTRSSILTSQRETLEGRMVLHPRTDRARIHHRKEERERETDDDNEMKRRNWNEKGGRRLLQCRSALDKLVSACEII